jgi:hypothetical protein
MAKLLNNAAMLRAAPEWVLETRLVSFSHRSFECRPGSQGGNEGVRDLERLAPIAVLLRQLALLVAAFAAPVNAARVTELY